MSYKQSKTSIRKHTKLEALKENKMKTQIQNHYEKLYQNKPNNKFLCLIRSNDSELSEKNRKIAKEMAKLELKILASDGVIEKRLNWNFSDTSLPVLFPVLENRRKLSLDVQRRLAKNDGVISEQSWRPEIDYSYTKYNSGLSILTKKSVMSSVTVFESSKTSIMKKDRKRKTRNSEQKINKQRSRYLVPKSKEFDYICSTEPVYERITQTVGFENINAKYSNKIKNDVIPHVSRGLSEGIKYGKHIHCTSRYLRHRNQLEKGIGAKYEPQAEDFENVEEIIIRKEELENTQDPIMRKIFEMRKLYEMRRKRDEEIFKRDQDIVKSLFFQRNPACEPSRLMKH